MGLGTVAGQILGDVLLNVNLFGWGRRHHRPLVLGQSEHWPLWTWVSFALAMTLPLPRISVAVATVTPAPAVEDCEAPVKVARLPR